MAPKILVLNGPNLNMLGKRQPELYGHKTLADVEDMCRAFTGQNASVDFRQTNYEGQLVDWIQEEREASNAIIINAGAYTHTSIAILDALYTFDGPVIEVHVSDIYSREKFRHHSYISQRADDVVVGMGVEGYEIALQKAGERLGINF